MVFVYLCEHGGPSTAKLIYTMDFLLVLDLLVPCWLINLCHLSTQIC